MSTRLAMSIGLAAALAGCATGRGGSEQPEFVGRTMQVEAANGQTSTLRFQQDGTVVARFGEQETRGTWAIEPRQLCFTWARNYRECWP